MDEKHDLTVPGMFEADARHACQIPACLHDGKGIAHQSSLQAVFKTSDMVDPHDIQLASSQAALAGILECSPARVSKSKRELLTWVLELDGQYVTLVNSSQARIDTRSSRADEARRANLSAANAARVKRGALFSVVAPKKKP